MIDSVCYKHFDARRKQGFSVFPGSYAPTQSTRDRGEAAPEICHRAAEVSSTPPHLGQLPPLGLSDAGERLKAFGIIEQVVNFEERGYALESTRSRI